MKALIIYHANCMDGFAAAWVTHSALTDKTTGYLDHEEILLHAAQYGDVPPMQEIDEGTEVFIVDFSYSQLDMIAISYASKHLVWIDHHKTAAPIAAHNYDGVFDMNHSGAMLAWMYFNPEVTPPKLIQYVEDRDMWWFKLPHSKQVSAWLSLAEKTILGFDIANLAFECSGGLNKIAHEGDLLLLQYNQLMDAIITATKTRICIDGKEGLCCNAPYQFASEIGNILASESGTFGCTWFEDSNRDSVFSIRSVGDYDVSEIAKSFGGGGHKNAAGFKLSYTSSNQGVILWSSGTSKVTVESLE